MPDLDLGPVPSGSSPLKAYLARPAGDGPFPGVLAIHEAFGVDAVLRRQVDRLANAGYLTLGPDLFSDGGAARCVVSTIRASITGKGKAFADIEAGRRWLTAQPECTGKIGIIGFCMGGAFALLCATAGFAVAADNYGLVPRHAETVLAGACPIVGSYGKSDRVLPPRQAAKLERVLTAAGVEHDVKDYPRAGHSFMNDAPNGPRPLRPLLRVFNIGPHPEAAADAWHRIEAFFAEHLAE